MAPWVSPVTVSDTKLSPRNSKFNATPAQESHTGRAVGSRAPDRTFRSSATGEERGQLFGAGWSATTLPPCTLYAQTATEAGSISPFSWNLNFVVTPSPL